MSQDRLRRLLSLGGAFALLLAGFFAFARPWYLRWGATDAELRTPLPGDEIVSGAASQETRAITIRAPAEAVWPWLAQLGQDRGGFYSFDLLENLVGCAMPVDDVLREELQHWQPGDRLWMYPPDKAGGAGFATLRVYVPGRALGFGTRMFGTPLTAPENGSWSFALVPVAADATRLLVRGRGTGGRSLLGVAFDRSIFEPIHFVMERRMLIGIKQLSEGGSRHRGQNHLHVLLWTVAFALFVAAGVRMMRQAHRGRALVGFVAAGVVFQVLTLGQPPVLIGAMLLAALGGWVFWPASRLPVLRRLRPAQQAPAHA